MIQKEGQRGSGTYPQNKDEVIKARANIVKMIHSQNVQARIVQALGGDPQQVVPAISKIISLILSKAIAGIRGKFGSKVNMKLVELLIKLSISEVDLIAENLGEGKMPPQVKVAMAKMIAQQLDQQLSGGTQQAKPAQKPGEILPEAPVNPGQPPAQPGQPGQGSPPQQQMPPGGAGLLGG